MSNPERHEGCGTAALIVAAVAGVVVCIGLAIWGGMHPGPCEDGEARVVTTLAGGVAVSSLQCEHPDHVRDGLRCTCQPSTVP